MTNDLFFLVKRVIVLLSIACLFSAGPTPVASAAIGMSKSQMDRLYGLAYVVQEDSAHFWTDREWQELGKTQPKAYGYSTTVHGLKATLWIEYDRQDRAVKEMLLMDGNVKIRYFEQYFSELNAVITAPDIRAVVIKGFPKDQLGIVAHATDRSLRLIRFFLSAEDKTCINMHSKIRGFEIATIESSTVSERLKGTKYNECGLNENIGKIAEDMNWEIADNYFTPEQYFSERLIPRKGTDLIVIHHAAMPTTTSRADIHELHLSNGWAGIGYHKLIFADGSVENGRPENVIGAHAAGANRRSLGIVLVGNFDQGLPSEIQLDAAVRLSLELMQKYHVPLQRVMPHRAVTEGTVCPGVLFPWQEFMQRLSLRSVNKNVKGTER